MRTYYVTIWDGDVIEKFVYLAESEKADLKTFNEKLHLKEWETIIAWSLIEE